MDQIHEIALDLRPKMLDDLGLVPTLRWYTNRFSKRLNMAVELNTQNMEDRLSSEKETLLYRIAQEALTNIAKHSKAHIVNINLERKTGTVSLSIQDDGEGFDVKKVISSQLHTNRLGLLGIREQVAPYNGQLKIKSKTGKGTTIMIKLPWD